MTDTLQTSIYMSPKFWAHARIGELLFACRPTAIFGCVVAITVLAIDRMFFARSRSHVGEKRLKTQSPAITNRYAPSAVYRVRSCLTWIFTTLNHAIPNLIFSRRFTAARYRYGHSMSRIGGLRCLNFIATAAKGISRFKIGSINDGLLPATATAKHPSNTCSAVLSNLRFYFLQNEQFSENLRNVILTGTH